MADTRPVPASLTRHGALWSWWSGSWWFTRLCDVEVFVLELTEQARRMVGELRRQRGLPHGGLRIARAGSGLGLWMSLESGPREGDHVLHLGEAVLYLDATAKHRLAGQTLDARTNAQGAAFFL